MAVQSPSSNNDKFIVVELAESLRQLLNRHAYHEADSEWDALHRYDKIFSKKPDVNCVCKNCRKDGA